MMVKFIFVLLIGCLLSVSAITQSLDTAIVNAVRKEKPFMRGKAEALRLTLELRSIHIQEEVFWMGLLLRNRSKLSYPVDIVRFYLRDNSQARRSSVQELEIIPVFLDTIKVVGPKDNTSMIVAFPKFTIPDKKSFVIEVFEQNGGRNLTLSINNWQLFKARPLRSHLTKH